MTDAQKIADLIANLETTNAWAIELKHKLEEAQLQLDSRIAEERQWSDRMTGAGKDIGKQAELIGRLLRATSVLMASASSSDRSEAMRVLADVGVSRPLVEEVDDDCPESYR